MSKKLFLIAIVFFSYESYGQQVKNSSLKNDSLRSLEDPPLEFGIDAGYYTGDDDLGIVMLSANIKIIRNKLFALIEYAQLFDKKFSDEGEFISLSADYRILNLEKGSLDYYVGIAGNADFSDVEGVGAIMGARYLYKVNKNFGLSGSVKFLNPFSNAYPFISIGIQVK